MRRDADTARILLAVPAYNCAPQIGRLPYAVARTTVDAVDKVVVIDNRSTDDQAAAAELPRLVARAEAEPYVATVLGSRYSGARSGSAAPARGRSATSASTCSSRRPSADLGSGLNVFAAAPLREGEFPEFDDRITFNIELLLHYFSRRAKLGYKPITWSEADQVSDTRNL